MDPNQHLHPLTTSFYYGQPTATTVPSVISQSMMSLAAQPHLGNFLYAPQPEPFRDRSASFGTSSAYKDILRRALTTSGMRHHDDSGNESGATSPDQPLGYPPGFSPKRPAVLTGSDDSLAGWSSPKSDPIRSRSGSDCSSGIRPSAFDGGEPMDTSGGGRLKAEKSSGSFMMASILAPSSVSQPQPPAYFSLPPTTSMMVTATSCSPTNSYSTTASPGSAVSAAGPLLGGALLPAPLNSLCVVCSDKASGYHYGVISCEGCKGFFRRSVQKREVYQCHKNGDCPVDRISRNRCQACRFHKCLHMGMAKESVRQDRNRKRKGREDQAEEELRATARIQTLIQAVVKAHSTTAITLQPPPSSVVDHLRVQLESGWRRVVEFAERIPGFVQLTAGDKATLLSRRHFGVLVIRSAFDTMQLPASSWPETDDVSVVGVLAKSVLKLRASFQRLQVEQTEAALLGAVYLVHAACPALEEPSRVERLQDSLTEALGVSIQLRAGGSHQQKNLFARLLMKIADIAAVADQITTVTGDSNPTAKSHGQ